MIKTWSNFLSQKRNLNETIFTFFLFGIISLVFSYFLIWVETRVPYLGEFIDPLFFWDPIDLSIPTFILTYGIIMFYIFFHLNSPLKVIHFIQMITFIVLCRIISLTLIQFDAPIPIDPSTGEYLYLLKDIPANYSGQTMIQLADPILNNIIYHADPDQPLNYTHHDLFFSGHTAKCLLASLLYKNKKVRIFFITLTCIMATFLLLQHVHYSIDIFFAPIVSFAAIYLHGKWKVKRLNKIKKTKSHIAKK